MTHEWHFLTRNSVRLMEKMSNEDKETFYFDVRRIHWESYLENYVSGIRTFVFKDDPSTLPAAMKNLKKYFNIQSTIKRKLVQFQSLNLFLHYFSPRRMKRFRMLAWLVFIGLLFFTFYALFVLAFWSIHSVVPNFQNDQNISLANYLNITDLDLF